MAQQKRWCIVVLLLTVTCLLEVTYGDGVRLLTRSKTSPLTSSTLRWVHGAETGIHVTEIVKGANLRPDATDRDYAADGTNEDDQQELEEEVEVIEVDDQDRLEADDDSSGGSVLLCRARHNGDLLPGALVGKECIVSLAKQVKSYKRYDVLRNVEKAGRLQWRKWNRFNGMPLGAVSADGLLYVARRHAGPDARQTHYLGKLDLNEGLGRVYVMEPEGKSWVERDYQDGEVLIEVEPVQYELKDVRFNERRIKLHQKPKILATTVIRRERNEEIPEDEEVTQNVASAMTYWNEPSSEYWGQGKGMLLGLLTNVHLPDDTRVLKWGVNSTKPGSEELVTVQAAMLPGTAINVSITGNHTQSETPYTARLVARYRDDKTRDRIINGTMHQVSLQGVKVEYGAHYFLHDGTLVPTTTTTTTEAPTTVSTTTTTTVKHEEKKGENQVIEKTDGTQNDSSNMLNVDTSVQQVPRTDPIVHSSATRHNFVSGVLFVLLVALLLPCRTGT